MIFRCVVGFHRYEKLLGPDSAGCGKFLQRYKCKVCEKVKHVIK